MVAPPRRGNAEDGGRRRREPGTRRAARRGAKKSLFAFGAKGPPTSAECEETRDGDAHFARAAAAAARAARARLCGSGASMRIFELECVKETLRSLELDEARA